MVKFFKNDPKSVILVKTKGGTRENEKTEKRMPILAGFFPKLRQSFQVLEVFGYLSSKKRKLLHCAQVILSYIRLFAQCNGPRLPAGSIVHFPVKIGTK